MVPKGDESPQKSAADYFVFGFPLNEVAWSRYDVPDLCDGVGPDRAGTPKAVRDK